jgi:hypothetical protein
MKTNFLALQRATCAVRTAIHNVAAHGLVQCPQTTRGKSLRSPQSQLPKSPQMKHQTVTDKRRLSARFTTILASRSQLQRSSDQAQVQTCATRHTHLSMHAPLLLIRAWGDPSSQSFKDHLREIIWQTWACRLFADLSRITFLRVQAQIVKASRRATFSDSKLLAQLVFREGAAYTLDHQTTDHRRISPSSHNRRPLRATQKTRAR